MPIEYNKKRKLGQSGEPAEERSTAARKKLRTFVIQKHDASRLHYDFRLAYNGVLKSWAVPKGIPTQKSDRRLAVEVEDHPLEYASFEGTIPEGNYGAGTVMLWDRGTYEIAGNEKDSFRNERLHLRLHGKKLEGEWTLVRMTSPDQEKRNWLLIKAGTSMKPISKAKDDESVVSKRTMSQISHDHDKEWGSDRSKRGAKKWKHSSIPGR